MNAYYPADEITLVHSGDDYFERLAALLDGAGTSIHLQTYIFEDDKTGRFIADALMRAAARGVRVRLLVDGFGSKKLKSAFIRDLQASGVEFRFFEHFISFWSWRFGRTLHHKVAVVDARQALVGGINIADKYRGSATEPAWLDFAVYIRGAACKELFQLCESIFLHQYWKITRHRQGNRRFFPQGDPDGLLRFRLNDWLRRKTEVYQSYDRGIAAARHSLTVVASYFLPGLSVRRRLTAAVRRGVAVQVLLTGPSDVELSRMAEQYLAWWLLRKGIRVFHWEKSVMHGKAILVDGKWASLGSFNINRLSRTRSLEMNVDVADPAFIRQFSDYLRDLLTLRCTEVTLNTIPAFSSRWGRIKARIAYHFAVYLMRFLFPERR